MYLISVEGVLADVQGSFGQAVPISEGRDLYDALHAAGQVGLICAEPNAELVRTWLRQERFTGYNELIVPLGSAPQDPPTWRAQQVRTARSRNWPVQAFIDADPLAGAAALHEGVVTIIISHPAYARPEWRPDGTRKVRAWDLMSGELALQETLKLNDPRITIDGGVYDPKDSAS